MLLAHRHPGRRWYPDCWDLVGGHIEDGESPLDAVVRECAEEIGVVVDDPTPFDVTIDDPALEPHAFLVTRWSGEIANCAPEEHDGLGWFNAAKTPTSCWPTPPTCRSCAVCSLGEPSG